MGNSDHGTTYAYTATALHIRVQPSFGDRLREGCRENRRCSRDTYPESYITKYTSIRREAGIPRGDDRLGLGKRRYVYGTTYTLYTYMALHIRCIRIQHYIYVYSFGNWVYRGATTGSALESDDVRTGRCWGAR